MDCAVNASGFSSCPTSRVVPYCPMHTTSTQLMIGSHSGMLRAGIANLTISHACLVCETTASLPSPLACFVLRPTLSLRRKRELIGCWADANEVMRAPDRAPPPRSGRNLMLPCRICAPAPLNPPEMSRGSNASSIGDAASKQKERAKHHRESNIQVPFRRSLAQQPQRKMEEVNFPGGTLSKIVPSLHLIYKQTKGDIQRADLVPHSGLWPALTLPRPKPTTTPAWSSASSQVKAPITRKSPTFSD